MPTYNYLPGVIVNTVDGGLTSAFAPQDDSILVIGTAGQGPVNTPYQVTDRALAAQTFGFSVPSSEPSKSAPPTPTTSSPSVWAPRPWCFLGLDSGTPYI